MAQRLAAALDGREARALFYRLCTEAAQATTTERMRMYATLIVAGCMANANVMGGGLYVTDVGRGVLKALELWR